MGNLIWILSRVRKPLWKIISIKRNQWSNLFLFFSNSDFPSRMYCDFYRTTLFLERLLFHTFSEWLLRHSSHIFGADIFSEQLLFSPFSEQSLSQQLFFQNSFFSEQKFYRVATSWEWEVFYGSYFLEQLFFLV